MSEDKRHYRPCSNKATHCISVDATHGAFLCKECLGNSKAFMPINEIPKEKYKRAFYSGLCQCSILVEDNDNGNIQTP